MDFTKTVKKKMKQNNLNGNDLARKTGYSVTYIYDLLAGHRRWNETTMVKVCKALGIKIDFVDEKESA